MKQREISRHALAKIYNEMRFVRERRVIEGEWYKLAVLIDRLAAICFTIYIIVIMMAYYRE